MDAAAINKLISRLGRTYAELISEGLIFRGSLMPLLYTAENEEWVQFPVEGVELWFAKKNVIFEKVLLTLIQRDENDHVYKGGLPSPFVSQMNQFSVRSELGMPYKSIGPSKLPGSGSKKSGGWDAYRLHQETHPGVRVGFSYNAEMMVETLTFALCSGE